MKTKKIKKKISEEEEDFNLYFLNFELFFDRFLFFRPF